MAQAQAQTRENKEFAKKLENLTFCIIWQLGGYGMVQNTPMECGNHLPTRIEQLFEKENNLCFCDFWILKLVSNLGYIILDLGAYLQCLEWLNFGTTRGGGGGRGRRRRVWLEEISRRVSMKGFPEGFG